MTNECLTVTNKSLMQDARTALQGRWNKAAGVTFIYTLLQVPSEFIPFVFIFIFPPTMLGISIYTLRIAQHKETSLSDFFSAFNDYLRALCAYLLMMLYVLLWALLLIIPGIIAMFSYSMMWFILAEHPEMSVIDAISHSRAMMEGKKMGLLGLYLNFIGWFLLGMLTLGIGFFWIIPYMMTSKARFYEEAKQQSGLLPEDGSVNQNGGSNE